MNQHNAYKLGLHYGSSQFMSNPARSEEDYLDAGEWHAECWAYSQKAYDLFMLGWVDAAEECRAEIARRAAWRAAYVSGKIRLDFSDHKVVAAIADEMRKSGLL